jgi:predicted transcriptional regulator
MTTRVVSSHFPDAPEQSVSLEERLDQLTREGLADMQTGRVLAHAAIEMWIASLATV